MMKARGSSLHKEAFTLIEMLVGFAVIGILATLIGLEISRIRNRADSAICTSNLRQIGIAANLYAGEHGGAYPPLPSNPSVSQGAYNICDVLSGGQPRWKYFGLLYGMGYLDNVKVFYCPTARAGAFDYESQWEKKRTANGGISSGFRIGYYQRIVDDSFPVAGELRNDGTAIWVLMTDANSSDNSQHPRATGSASNAAQRGINVLFSDGHVYYDDSGRYWNQIGQQVYQAWERNR